MPRKITPKRAVQKRGPLLPDPRQCVLRPRSGNTGSERNDQIKHLGHAAKDASRLPKLPKPDGLNSLLNQEAICPDWFDDIQWSISQRDGQIIGVDLWERLLIFPYSL